MYEMFEYLDESFNLLPWAFWFPLPICASWGGQSIEVDMAGIDHLGVGC